MTAIIITGGMVNELWRFQIDPGDRLGVCTLVAEVLGEHRDWPRLPQMTGTSPPPTEVASEQMRALLWLLRPTVT